MMLQCCVDFWGTSEVTFIITRLVLNKETGRLSGVLFGRGVLILHSLPQMGLDFESCYQTYAAIARLNIKMSTILIYIALSVIILWLTHVDDVACVSI